MLRELLKQGTLRNHMMYMKPVLLTTLPKHNLTEDLRNGNPGSILHHSVKIRSRKFFDRKLLTESYISVLIHPVKDGTQHSLQISAVQ